MGLRSRSPLAGRAFNDAKSDIAVLDYAAAGIPCRRFGRSAPIDTSTRQFACSALIACLRKRSLFHTSRRRSRRENDNGSPSGSARKPCPRKKSVRLAHNPPTGVRPSASPAYRGCRSNATSPSAGIPRCRNHPAGQSDFSARFPIPSRRLKRRWLTAGNLCHCHCGLSRPWCGRASGRSAGFVRSQADYAFYFSGGGFNPPSIFFVRP